MPYRKLLVVGKMFLARKQKNPLSCPPSPLPLSNHSGKYPGEGKDIPQLIQGSFVSLLAAFLWKLKLCPLVVHPEKKGCFDVQLDPILSGILMFLLKGDKPSGECGRRNCSRNRVNTPILPCCCFFPAIAGSFTTQMSDYSEYNKRFSFLGSPNSQVCGCMCCSYS